MFDRLGDNRLRVIFQIIGGDYVAVTTAAPTICSAAPTISALPLLPADAGILRRRHHRRMAQHVDERWHHCGQPWSAGGRRGEDDFWHDGRSESALRIAEEEICSVTSVSGSLYTTIAACI